MLQLFNPECWPLGALIGFAIILYILVAACYLLLYVPITIGKLIRLIILGYFAIFLCLMRALLRVIRACINLVHQVLMSGEACQEVNVFSANTHICQKSLTGEHCEIHVSEVVKINSFRKEACLRLYENQTFVSLLRIKWKNLLYCDHEAITYTKDAELRTLTSKRCAHMGTCKGQKCAKIRHTDLVPELERANKFPRRTGCFESCGGLGCDCFYPSSACLFYRIYAVPKTSTIYELSRCSLWRELVKIEFSQSYPNKIHQIPLITVQLGGYEITMTSLSLPPLPVLSQRFISNYKEIAIWPNKNMPALLCETYDKAANLSCVVHDNCRCEPAEVKVRCECEMAKIASAFSNIESKLPVHYPGLQFFTANSTQVVAKFRDTASAEHIVKFQGSIAHVIQETRSYDCFVSDAALEGCYRCKKGAVANIQCSSAAKVLGEIQCEHNNFVALYSPKNPTTQKAQNCEIWLLYLQHCLRTLHATAPLLIAVGRTSDAAWNAMLEQPHHYTDAQGRNRSLPIRQNVVERIIWDQPQSISNLEAELSNMRSRFQREERAQHESHMAKLTASLNAMQSSIQELTISNGRGTIPSRLRATYYGGEDPLEIRIASLQKQQPCRPQEYSVGLDRANEARMRCVFCGSHGKHYSDSCTRIRDSKRRKLLLKRDNRCNMCLEMDCPATEDCPKFWVFCFHCEQMGHHSAICIGSNAEGIHRARWIRRARWIEEWTKK
ncbi:unnamed protein product [Heligmosomoides polygyrus]|uniref:Phlebovirus_G2 domain-containing protein n=1 Tax=Heligmosomoides polygyrus TaxID=6339 RepID=A0A183FFK4_HELPZ|nr:unnamed protein product [Heligmosomoides polygyrus]